MKGIFDNHPILLMGVLFFLGLGLFLGVIVLIVYLARLPTGALTSLGVMVAAVGISFPYYVPKTR